MKVRLALIVSLPVVALRLLPSTTAACQEADARSEVFDRGTEQSPGAEQPPAEATISGAERARALDQQLAEIFAGHRYGFCHDPEYVPRGEERNLCGLAGGRQDRCASVATACSNQPEPEPKQKSYDGGPLARVVFWLVAGLGLLAILGFAVRAFTTRREVGAQTRDPLTPGPPNDAQPVDSTAPLNGDPMALFQMAEAHANAGDFSTAMTLTYAAFLRQLEKDQKLRLESTQTNGDLARQLVGEPEARTILRGAAEQVEAIQFGSSPATSATYRTLLAAVQPTLARALMVLAIATPLWILPSACNVQKRVLSARIDGTEAFRQVLALYAEDVQTRRQPVEDLDESTQTVVALSGFLPNEAQKNALRSWVEAGGLLVLSSGAMFEDEELELHPSSLQGWRQCRPSLDDSLQGELPNVEVSGPPGMLTLGDSWSALVRCGDAPYVAVRYWGDGVILALADQSFISNGLLATSDNAHVLLRYLRDPGNVEFLTRSASAESDSPYLALMNANLGGLLWHALAFLLFFYAWRGAAFGRLRLPVQRQRRAFTEHVEALGRLYRKAGATRMVLLQYGNWLVEHMRASTLRGRDTRLLELASGVARRTGAKETDVVRLLVEALTARDGPMTSNSEEDLNTVRELEALARSHPQVDAIQATTSNRRQSAAK